MVLEQSAVGINGAKLPSQDKLRAMHRTMVRIRQFEERVKTDYLARKMPGFTHSYVGEEAVATGGCAALEPGDLITSTHRGHGHAIAKGVGLGAMMAELYGKVTGTCRGRGGSMHIADFSLGMLGANGIVGGGFGLAAGAALAANFLKTGEVTLCFFGDGAINKGTFHEAMNFSGIRRLPVVFLCENNQFAQYMAVFRMHESWAFCGVGAEVASEIQEALFDVLDAPVLRVGAKTAHIPFAPVLERAVVPGAEEIVEAVRRLAGPARRHWRKAFHHSQSRSGRVGNGHSVAERRR
jgi:hypothetical protein